MSLRRSIVSFLFAAAFFALSAGEAAAQFKEEAFQQNYSDEGEESTAKADTASNGFFNLKTYRNALWHNGQMSMSNMVIGSAVFVGGAQIYNKQYWKLPIVYGSLAVTVGSGFALRSSYLADNSKIAARNWSTGLFIAGGLAYWATMFDGVHNYRSDNPHFPPRATMYSLLLPGLGQIYNGEAWKLPIYWGGMIGGLHFYLQNRKNYIRFRNIYNMASDPEKSSELEASWPHGAETALYYRNIYRRYRDYSLLTIAGVYLLQAIDANVFAYMQDFEVTDDISLRISPTVISADNCYAYSPSPAPALGMGLRLRF